MASKPISEERNLRWVILFSVVASRLVYAISWYDISPALVDIGHEFRVGLPSLGILTSAFIVGVGIFQVPAGGLASRWGAKRTALLGLAVMAVSDILSGAAPSFLLLLMSRFLVGLGAALFFAPAIGIITPLFEPERRGLVIGLYNGAFGVGAGIGLFGWAILEVSLGWRLSLAITGVVTAILAVENLAVMGAGKASTNSVTHPVRRVLRSRHLWLWGIGLLGFWGALYAAGSFLQPFATTTYMLPSWEAGLLAASINFAAVAGGPIGGGLSDAMKSRRNFMILPAAVFGVGMMLIGSTPSSILWVLAVFLGFVDGFVFASLYASPSQLPEVGADYASVAIGLINSIQILGSFWIPFVFTLVAEAWGYVPGWIFLGGITLVFLPLVALTKEPFKYQTEEPLASDK